MRIYFSDEASLNRLSQKLDDAERQFVESKIDEELNKLKIAKYHQVSGIRHNVVIPSRLTFKSTYSYISRLNV